MNRFAHTCLFGCLALAICLVAAPSTRSADDEEEEEKANVKEAKKATEKLKGLIDAIAAGKAKDVPALAKALNGKTDLKHIMWAAYKPGEKAGVGVGADATGIEVKLITISKKPLTAAQLQKEGADLIRMAQVAQAMNEIAEMNTPAKNQGKKLIVDWKKFNAAQKTGAQDLINAVNKNDPKAAQTAATNLYSSCTNCHAEFRD